MDGNVPSPQAAELRAASLQRERERDAQAVRRESGRRQRIEAREWLHFLTGLYQDSVDRLSDLRQRMDGAFEGEVESHWKVLVGGGVDAIRKADSEYQPPIMGLGHDE